MLLGAAAAAAASVAPQNPPPFASSSCCTSFCQRERRRLRSTSQSQLPPIASVLNLRGSAAPPPPRFLSQWTGAASLKQLRLPSLRLIEKRGRFRRKAPYASLFGVGAPEALVIGVVALLVFGPKGLAEVARNLGKTLRAFQPTIRELQDVSREFKSTLEREIGLDEVSSPANNSYNGYKANSFSDLNQQVTDPNGAPKSGAYTSEDLLKVTQEQLVATSTESEEPKTIPGVQRDLTVAASDGPSKVAASTTAEAADQVQSSEKLDKER